MATIRIPILGFGTVPDSSGDVFFELASIKATTAPWDHLICVFNDSGNRDGLHGRFSVPKDFVGSSKLIITWTSTATTNSTVWDFDYRAIGGNDTESLDQSGTQESVTVTDAAPSASLEKMEAEITLTASNLAVDDQVQFTFFRSSDDGSDTMAAAALLYDLEFEYADA